MKLSLLEDAKEFRTKNKKAWENCWKYWYMKEYIHQGIHKYLCIELNGIKQEFGKLSVLDLGCGSSWCAKYFHNIYDEYVGVDFNTSLIGQLKKDFDSFPKCSFLNYDLESNGKIPLLSENFEVILANFILIELADLKSFFKKTASLQKAGQYLIIAGLDPLNEIFRASASLREVNANLSKYRHAAAPVVISKNMSFNGDDTKFLYHRILYSINDLVTVAIDSGYEICEINDKLNKNAESIKAPIYFTIKMRLKC